MRSILSRTRIGGPTAIPVEWLGVQIDDDVFDLGVEIESVAAELAANATLLEAAEWSFGRVDGRIVDADVAGLDAAGHGVGTLDVIRPDRGGESEDRAVGGGDDFVFSFERYNRENRAEDFVLS